MFSAFVIACAANINLEVIEDTCLRFNDSWGPYKTEENCTIRAKQLHIEITEGVLKEFVFISLNNPAHIIAVGFCEKLIEDQAV
jgi:hypothetical protein